MPRAAETLQRDYTQAYDSSANYVQEPTPAARTSLLVGADVAVLAAALCYSQPALIYDSTTTLTRRFSLVTPPFARQATAHFTCFGDPLGAFQSPIETDTTTSGSIGTSYDLTDDSATILTPNAGKGTRAFGDIGGAVWHSIISSAATIDRQATAAGASIDRQVDLAEAKVRQVEDVETRYAYGFGLTVTVRSQDMETV